MRKRPLLLRTQALLEHSPRRGTWVLIFKSVTYNKKLGETWELCNSDNAEHQ